MPKISIIIPVYNAEKYIRKCLESILTQTHTNWEAILVDDGSPDNCGIICDEYAAKDNRFKVIHQANGGVSVARQTGLDNAKGEYIIHCDSDDWVEPNILEEMLQCAIANNADMVICDFIEEHNHYSRYNSQGIEKRTNSEAIRNKLLKDELLGVLWNKLIKKDCIKGFRFIPTNIYYCEDLLFIIRILNNDIKIFHCPYGLYHYNLKNTASTCKSSDAKIILSRCNAIYEIEKITRKEEYNNIYYLKISVLKMLFLTKNYNELKTTYTEIHGQIKKNHRKYNFFTPYGFFFAMAIKGKPKLANFLYNVNIGVIHLIQRIRGRNNFN